MATLCQSWGENWLEIEVLDMAYREKWIDDILRGRTLVSCALDVHMTASGAFERSSKEQNDDIRVLRAIIDSWKPGIQKYEKFDNAVKNLITAALDEIPSKHWNYRIIHHLSPEEEYWAIHEVYYEKDKPVSYSENPAVVLSAENPGDLVWTLNQMLEALQKPVLEKSDFYGESQ